MSKAQEAGSAERNYIAFISYRHKPLDKEAAERIQRSIERYIVPKELREKAGGKKLGMVFRDEDELPASSSLSGSITYALDHSKYLLVICTPDLPLSRWCEQEIRYFLKTHDRDHVLAVLVDGEPEVSFSPYLLHTFDEEGNITGDTEPLAANIAGENHSIDKKAFKKEIVRIYAALLGCPFDALWQRERRARANRLLALGAAAMTVMAVFLVTVLMKNAEISQRNREIEAQNAEIQAKNEAIQAQNEEISQQNDTIAAQNDSLQKSLSTALVDSALQKLEDHDIYGALRNCLEAMETDKEELRDPRTAGLLADSLHAYRGRSIQSRILYQQSTEIVDLEVTSDGNRAFLADQVGAVRCVDAVSGELLWEAAPWVENGSSATEHQMELMLLETQGLLLCRRTSCIAARSLEDGSVVWSWVAREYGGCAFRALSPDKQTLLLLDSTEPDKEVTALQVLDTATGQIRAEIPLILDSCSFPITSVQSWFGWCGGFSSRGDYAALALYGKYAEEGQEAEDALCCLVFDLKDNSICSSFAAIEDASLNFFYGLRLLDDGNVILGRYASQYGAIVVSHIDFASGHCNQIKSGETLPTRTGTLMELDSERNVLPMLCSNHLALIASSNTLHVYRLDQLREAKSFAFQSPIISMEWLERGNEVVEIIAENGRYTIFDLGHEDYLLERHSSGSLDSSGIRLVYPIEGGPARTADGLLFTIPDALPGHMLRSENVMDPSGNAPKDQPQFYSSSLSVLPSPSGERIFVFYPASELTVISYDAETLEEAERASFDGFFSYSFTVLDDSHFLYGSQIYGLDGSVTPLKGIPEADRYPFSDYAMSGVTLSDGRSMEACMEWNRLGKSLCHVWLDGEMLTASQNVASGLAFFDMPDTFILSPAGYVLAQGIWARRDEHGTILPSENRDFVIFDALSGKRIVLSDEEPGAAVRPLAVANQSRRFVCCCDSGNIRFYDLDGKTALLPSSYSPGEVSALAFSDDDALLLVLTHAGRLDIWGIQDGVRLYSENAGIPSGYLSIADNLHCRMDPERHQISVFFSYGTSNCFGFWSLIDTRSWVSQASAQEVYACLDGRLYSLRNSKLTVYPIHSLEDLADWARDTTLASRSAADPSSPTAGGQ